MYGSKHLTNVALFPLCDTGGVLIDTLCDTGETIGTRADALIFAWRLALPKRMSVAEAANAILLVAVRVQRVAWTRYQLQIVRELMALAEWDKDLREATVGPLEPNRALASDIRNIPDKLSLTRSAKKAGKDRRSPRRRRNAGKEHSEWWRLVGRNPAEPSAPSTKNERRKTRVERASQEP